MSKLEQVLIYSIQPEHVLNFLRGRKTDEIRKRDLPQWAKDKIARGEIVEGYGYCTKGKPYLEPRECNGEFVWNIHNDFIYHTDLNGKVVFKFEVSGVEKIPFIDSEDWVLEGYYDIQPHDIPLKACLDIRQLNTYGNGADLYAHHFTNITPIEPMELREFTATTIPDDAIIEKDVGGNEYFYYKDRMAWRFYFGRLSRPPQSFMTAWVKEEMK